MILAQYVAAGSLAQMVILFILVVVVIAIGLVVFRHSGVQIPPWIAQIGWLVLLAVVAIFAVKFLMGWV